MAHFPEQNRRLTQSREPLPAPSIVHHPARDPLPAGSPVTWNAITKGTLLEGRPYPARSDSHAGGTAMSAQDRLYDVLVEHWLDNTENGRDLMRNLGLSRDAARHAIQDLRARGLVRIETSEPDADGVFSLRIEAAVPGPANDVRLNRHERRAAARRARA